VTTDRQAPHHRTLTCYTDYRCRLPECVERYNTRNLERLRAHRDGTWNALVDAAPVRQHILNLGDAGVGPGSIAVTTGLPIQSVLEFIRPRAKKGRGRKQRTTPDTAAKILAVTVDNSVARRIDSTGTVRRLQALVAIGWPLRTIALHAGLGPHNMSDFARRSQVFASTAAKVTTAYEQLRSLKPERHGVDKGQAKRARNMAASRRWPPPRYWDERMDVINDPEFEPMYGVTRREIVANDANELMRFSGLDRAAAADRLGISKAYIDHAFRDHPEYAVEVAA
jgi:hypothetical protein